MERLHESVLAEEAVGALRVQKNDTVVDATVGGAGHFAALLSLLGEGGLLIGIDADAAALERARTAYAQDQRAARPTAHFAHGNFRNLSNILAGLGISAVNKALFDLGWSGYQLSDGRGFSFQKDEPLLMRYGEEGMTAEDMVNGLSESELREALTRYGEERFAGRIARAIIAARRRARIRTTGELVEIILGAVPRAYRHQKTHAATKTFQALRILTNDEFGALLEGLSAALNALAAGGRIAVISFHSGEDRIVKNLFAQAVREKRGVLVFKKPVAPSRAEILKNRRARSAKLRVFERHA